MNRTSFLKTLASLVVAPFAIKALPKAEEAKIAPRFESLKFEKIGDSFCITGCFPVGYSSFPAIKRNHTLSYKSVDE